MTTPSQSLSVQVLRACCHSTHQFQSLSLGVEQLLDVSTRRSAAAHCCHLLPHHLRVVDRVFPARRSRHDVEGILQPQHNSCCMLDFTHV